MKQEKHKELLFSVGADDCDWTYYIGPGNGGQNKQKTSSAARCTHRASKAVGKCHDSRSQLKNKQTAFVRMTETPQFKTWLKLEIARQSRDKVYEEQEQARLERVVDEMMRPENIRTQIKKDGEWIDISEEELMKMNEDE